MTLSSPTRGPQRRLLVVQFDSSTAQLAIREYMLEGQNAVLLHQAPLSSVGLTNPSSLHFSGDGLRMIISGSNYVADLTQRLVYADRATTADPFGPPSTLDGILAGNVFMTENCDRLYLGQFSTLFYVRQIP